ncbi:Fur family transcriptional regulator [Segatella bryantii]|uniref:Fur family transcriptional regulator n=1 Tax=Segatella bryantii TaxID=77095 RepID=UPI0024320B94|nr:Fur family transcriptional regulator [Segatella bryantii]
MTDREEALKRLTDRGVRPSVQRIAIMEYLLTHHTHPTVDDVYQGLCDDIPTLSKTTVYNTLRLLADHNAAQMLTIDDHRVCYDGDTRSHVHFFCKQCGKVIDLFDEDAPVLSKPRVILGNIVEEQHLYYKGFCADCAAKKHV